MMTILKMKEFWLGCLIICLPLIFMFIGGLLDEKRGFIVGAMIGLVLMLCFGHSMRKFEVIINSRMKAISEYRVESGDYFRQTEEEK